MVIRWVIDPSKRALYNAGKIRFFVIGVCSFADSTPKFNDVIDSETSGLFKILIPEDGMK